MVHDVDPDLLREAALDAENGNGCTAKKLLDSIPSLEDRWLTLMEIGKQTKADGLWVEPKITLWQDRVFPTEESRYAFMQLFAHEGRLIPESIFNEKTSFNDKGVQRTSDCKRLR